MSDINRSYFTGRLGRDPELRYTQSGTAVCSVSLAVERMKAKNADRGDRGETDWIDLVAWAHTAEYMSKYFSKGNLVMVEAQARTRTYDDKNGVKHKVTEFLVSDIKSSGNGNSGQQSYAGGGNSSSYQPRQDSQQNSGNDLNEGFMDVAPNEDGLPFN